MTVLLALAFLPQTAHAQDGLDAHGMRIAPQRSDVHGGLSVRVPTGFQPGDWYAAMVFEYANDLVTLRQHFEDGTSSESLALGRAGFVDLAAGVAVHRRLQLDVSMPVSPFSTGLDGPNGFLVGDLRVGATVPVVELTGDHGLGVSLSPWVEIPTGSPEALFGNMGVGGGGELSAAVRSGRWTVGGSAGYAVRPDVQVKNLKGTDQVTGGLSMGFAPTETWGMTAELLGATSLAGDGAVPPVEARLISRNHVGGGLSVLYGGAVGLTSGIGASDWRAFAGLSFSPPRKQDEAIPAQAPEIAPVPEVVAEVAPPVVEAPEVRQVPELPAPTRFAFASSEIPGSDLRVLEEAARALLAADAWRIEVAGHTDAVGPELFNQGLSERRAQAVVDHLVAQGVDPRLLVLRGYGETSPAATNDTAEGRAVNRRVELRILEPAPDRP